MCYQVEETTDLEGITPIEEHANKTGSESGFKCVTDSEVMMHEKNCKTPNFSRIEYAVTLLLDVTSAKGIFLSERNRNNSCAPSNGFPLIAHFSIFCWYRSSN